VALTAETDAHQGAPDPQDAANLERLRDENLQLRHAVDSHATVDQAIGVVLAVGRLAPDDGWDVLLAVSQHTNIRLRRVAEEILAWVRTGELSAEIRGELERQLALRDGTGEAGRTDRAG
jgi:hypothetical protein